MKYSKMVMVMLQWCDMLMSCLLLLLSFCSLWGQSLASIQSADGGTVGVSQEVMAGRQLYVYTAYKDMQIFHFTVPPLTSKVTFSFTANDTEACDPRDLGMYVTPGSYPVVAAAGEAFPPDLWVERGVRVYPVALRSDNVAVKLSIVSPVPGPWFVAGAVTEDSNRITQAGLVPSCQSYVRIEATYQQQVQVVTVLPSLSDLPQSPIEDTITSPTYYRFYVGPYGFSATVSISGCTLANNGSDGLAAADDNSSSVSESCPVLLELTPLALSHHSSNHSTVVNCSDPNSRRHHRNIEELSEWMTTSSMELTNDTDSFTAVSSDDDATFSVDGDWNYTGSGNESSTESGQCGLVAIVMEDAWHYVSVVPLQDSVVRMQLSVQLKVCDRCSSPTLESSRESEASVRLSLSGNDTSATATNSSEDGLADYEAASNSSYDSPVIGASLNGGEDTELLSRTNHTESDKELDRSDAFNNIDSNSVDSGLLLGVEDVLEGDRMGLNGTEEEEMTNVTKAKQSSGTFLPAEVPVDESTCWNRHDLVRKTFSGNFVFEYDLAPDDNGSVPLMVNVSTAAPSLLAFSLTPFLDLGGTLAVELALYPFLNTSLHHYRLSACLTSGLPAFPGHNTACRHGRTLHLNTSSADGLSSSGSLDNIAEAILIPFPDPGPWYISINAGCYQHNNSSTNDSTPTVTPVACTSDAVTAIFSVSSSSCIHGKCGKYGSCYQYIYAGYIFSTCVCDAGYRGWSCNDGSEATSDWVLLLATLLLTLSNLAFLPAVALAGVRRHYTEALVYTFTMFFSTLYHACDQQTYNWCLLRLSVLQFCDFYSAILAFWVTLIAMAEVPAATYSLLHMAGAVMVALGVEFDRTGLWVFVVPAASAFVVMAVSWGIHSKSRRECYPPRRYWLCCLLPGTMLAATGLICYAFLETHDNYQYVHSAWHVTMALSILCLLPPRRKYSIDRVGAATKHRFIKSAASLPIARVSRTRLAVTSHTFDEERVACDTERSSLEPIYTRET